MATLIIFHDVEDGKHWAKAWQKKAGSRHEMFGKIGVTARTFEDAENPNATGLILDVPNMEEFQMFMASDEANKAMQEDGLKVDSLRILREFSP